MIDIGKLLVYHNCVQISKGTLLLSAARSPAILPKDC